MATEKPRLSLTMDPELLERVNAFRAQNRISTQSKAIHRLMRMALEEWERAGTLARASSVLPEETLRVAEGYQALDGWGRQAVRSLLACEQERMEDESRFQAGPGSGEPKVIPLYLFPAAAGYAAPVMNEEFELYELTPEDPPGAEFAVRLQGDSMEPDFPDGSTVFCNHDPLAEGDIGIFCLDSGTVCKQYYRDPAGFVYLFSLNRARSGADLLISPGGNQTFICQGRVITRKRYPVPGRGL